MPYIKPLVEPPFAAVGRLLRGYEVTPVALAEKTGWSYGKSAARLSSPQTLTLAELDLIFRKFHIGKEKAIAAICDGFKVRNSAEINQPKLTQEQRDINFQEFVQRMYELHMLQFHRDSRA